MENFILDEELLELEGIEEWRKQWQTYSYNNNPVPRVSHILKQCEDQEGLIQWAANIGRRKYDFYRTRALEIGTIIHGVIDDYILYHLGDPNYKINYGNFQEFQYDYKNQIDCGFNNFLLWLENLKSRGGNLEEVFGVEIPVACPWFGGTLDAIFKINGSYYIIDFKSSKQISSSYLLQTSAYMWCINNGYAILDQYGKHLPHIDGIGIIRVDKNKNSCLDDLFLNSKNPIEANYLNQFTNCFMSYVNSFYRSKSCDYIYEIYYNQYNPMHYER